MTFKPGQVTNPLGGGGQKPLTDALILRLRHDAGSTEKPKTVAHAIVERLISNALQGDQKAIDMIFDRVEGKAVQHIEQKTTHEVLSVVEAARRIAFALNTAAMEGIEIEGEFAELVPPDLPAVDYTPVDLPAVSLKPPKGAKLSTQLADLPRSERKKLTD